MVSPSDGQTSVLGTLYANGESREAVQNSERLQNGEADMDDLCSQLKSKAKCSGSGPVIAQSDIDQILGPALAKQNGQADYLKMFK